MREFLRRDCRGRNLGKSDTMGRGVKTSGNEEKPDWLAHHLPRGDTALPVKELGQERQVLQGLPGSIRTFCQAKHGRAGIKHPRQELRPGVLFFPLVTC